MNKNCRIEYSQTLDNNVLEIIKWAHFEMTQDIDTETQEIDSMIKNQCVWKG